MPCRSFAQRRPGREPRRHHPTCRAATIVRRWSLNEGRGANPGDTAWPAAIHVRCGQRSTKAGARTPATLHLPGRDNAGRALNEGSRTPATQHLPGRGHHHAERSTKAGARTPATRACPRSAHPAPRALNEGRGANPGDTRYSSRPCWSQRSRSTKAGARTPATPLVYSPSGSASGRSTKAGARTPATPLGRLPVDLRDARSTKAGARTPATLYLPVRVARLRWPLNEGRGANPGDTTASSSACRPVSATLNEGRGANPGDTRAVRGDRGAGPPRSTKAGARTPATPGFGPASMACTCAQRRPGREPRRHF